MIRELFDLKGRTALITGGSRGLGLNLAHGLSEMGARVILVARDPASLKVAVDSIAAPADQKAILPADVAALDGIPALVQRAAEVFGGIDILVNNAGIAAPGPAETVSIDRWQSVIDVNLSAPFLLAREVARLCMIPARRGRILNMSSVGGLFGNRPDLRMAIASYNASKAGLIGLTRALACEWGCHDITVNALCPGFFETDMNKGLLSHIAGQVLPTVPLERFGGKHDLIGPALLLVSDAGRHITGQTLVVDGGMTCA
jgi:NAD(P)-dependent dehydrogenase (short-subunit alcohol dehydrogenase family)